MTEEWLDFIVSCRLGKPHTYDIVEGPMADDATFNCVQNLIDGKISRAAFWELAKSSHATHKISFHTISALDTLTFIGSEEVYERVIEDCYSDGDILKGIWEVYYSWIDDSISDYNTDFIISREII